MSDATRRTDPDWRLYARLLREARAYVPHLCLVFLLSLAAAPLALLLPLPVQVAVDSVIGTAPPPRLVTILWPGDHFPSREALLLLCAVLFVAVMLLQHLEGFASWLLQLHTGEHLVLNLRARLFEHLQRTSLVYHDRAGTADAVYRIHYDAPAIQYVLVSGIIPLLTSVVTVLAMLYVIMRISPSLAWIAALAVPVLFGLTEWYRRRIRGRWSAIKTQENQAMGVVQQALSALRVVKAFGQEARERDRFERASGEALRAHLRLVKAESVFGLAVAVAPAVRP